MDVRDKTFLHFPYLKKKKIITQIGNSEHAYFE